MTEKPIFDLLSLQGFLQEGVVLEIDHAERQVITGAPIGVRLAQFVGAERSS
jgi:hypothetical protein